MRVVLHWMDHIICPSVRTTTTMEWQHIAEVTPVRAMLLQMDMMRVIQK